MKRFHLFEWEDLPWFPSSFRSYITDLLQHRLNYFNVYDPVLPHIETLLEVMGEKEILDLCSGGGGFLMQVDRKLREKGHDIEITMTDKYPNLDAFEEIRRVSDSRISYSKESIDVTAVPADLKKVRTIFSAFHHFQPDTAKAILQDAVNKNTAIGIFEMIERTPPAIVKAALFSPLITLLQTPQVKPFKWSRLFWTYLIPIVPFVTAWDGVVSNLRSYSDEDFLEMTGSLENSENYHWEIQKDFVGGKAQIPVTSVIGYPKQ